ncbi:MAG: hypothetical protein JSS66_06200 [Armatimonadetes bacterium]|nr:hypothetical protein [Armatimonadota bacterium]
MMPGTFFYLGIVPVFVTDRPLVSDPSNIYDRPYGRGWRPAACMTVRAQVDLAFMRASNQVLREGLGRRPQEWCRESHEVWLLWEVFNLGELDSRWHSLKFTFVLLRPCEESTSVLDSYL